MNRQHGILHTAASISAGCPYTPSNSCTTAVPSLSVSPEGQPDVVVLLGIEVPDARHAGDGVAVGLDVWVGIQQVLGHTCMSGR